MQHHWFVLFYDLVAPLKFWLYTIYAFSCFKYDLPVCRWKIIWKFVNDPLTSISLKRFCLPGALENESISLSASLDLTSLVSRELSRLHAAYPPRESVLRNPSFSPVFSCPLQSVNISRIFPIRKFRRFREFIDNWKLPLFRTKNYLKKWFVREDN